MRTIIYTAFCLALSPLFLHGSNLTGNLLTNPGAESGSISGWVTGGTSNPDVDNGSFDPGINPHSGSFDFYGGTGASGTLSQTQSILVAGITASTIDSGALLADVDFFEQGLDQGTPSDDAFVTLTFLDGSSNTLSSLQTPTIDSHDSAWMEYSNGYAIPVGTRSITYTMNFMRNSGSDLDAFVDDNSLTISSASAPTTTPEPATSGLVVLSGGLALFGLLRRRVEG